MRPREAARVVKKVPETQRQEDLRRRIETQQALPEAKTPRGREYGPPSKEMGLDRESRRRCRC